MSSQCTHWYDLMLVTGADVKVSVEECDDVGTGGVLIWSEPSVCNLCKLFFSMGWSHLSMIYHRDNSQSSTTSLITSFHTPVMITSVTI